MVSSVKRGIGKILEKDGKYLLVDLDSHNQNVGNICESYHQDFIGDRELLVLAGEKHDMGKLKSLNPGAIFKQGSNSYIFPRHATIFPGHWIEEDFDEVIFDLVKNKRQYKNLYIYHLITMHHTSFSLDTLMDRADFIYERGNQVRNQIRSFLKDWYALRLADWIDSAIMEVVFRASELPSIDMKFQAETDIMVKGEKEFSLSEPGIFGDKVSLIYRYCEVNEKGLKDLTAGSSQFEARNKLLEYFSGQDLKELEVKLYES